MAGIRGFAIAALAVCAATFGSGCSSGPTSQASATPATTAPEASSATTVTTPPSAATATPADPEPAELEAAIIEATGCTIDDATGRSAVGAKLLLETAHIDLDEVQPDDRSFVCWVGTVDQPTGGYLAALFADAAVVDKLVDGHETPELSLCYPVGTVGPWLLTSVRPDTPSPALQAIVESYDGSMIITC